MSEVPPAGPQATMRISDVLSMLREQFPAVTHSKLRFLEEQGLITPIRTAAGYRQYSAADVERLRFVLTEQRDRYLPLKVIREKLDHERGTAPAQTAVAPPAVDTDGEADAALVDSLMDAGLIDRDALTDPAVMQIVGLAAELAPYGIEPRHLRALKMAADRHLSLIEQVIAPWARGATPTARTHAADVAGQVGALCTALHAAWVRQGIDDLTT